MVFFSFLQPGGEGCPEHTHIAPVPDIYRGKFRYDLLTTHKVNSRISNPGFLRYITCSWHQNRSFIEIFFNRDQDYPGEDLGKMYANEVKDIIDKLQAEGKSPGCFIAESLQSCGGQVIPPPNYLSTSSSHVFTNSLTTNLRIFFTIFLKTLLW